MHVADQILVEAFEVQIGGERVGPEAVFPDWSRRRQRRPDLVARSACP
jgi:hypothetical protein